MSITARQSLEGNVTTRISLVGSLDVGMIEKRPDYYEGEYNVVPTDKEQVLEMAELVARENVVVKPIPKEYGYITYNQDKTITIT